MKEENNKLSLNTVIIKSLEDLISVCEELNCQFRIFGSLIYAALKGDFYRKIGDIDCFIDGKFKKAVVNELKKRGYTISAQKDEDISLPLYFIGFKTENFLKDNNKLSLIFIFFKEEYVEIPLRLGFSLRIPYDLINRNYKFYGKEFKGLTPEAALFNLSLITRDKIKRKIDADILLPFCNPETIQKIKQNTDTLFWFNKRLPLISKILASKIDKYLPSSRF